MPLKDTEKRKKGLETSSAGATGSSSLPLRQGPPPLPDLRLPRWHHPYSRSPRSPASHDSTQSTRSDGSHGPQARRGAHRPQVPAEEAVSPNGVSPRARRGRRNPGQQKPSVYSRAAGYDGVRRPRGSGAAREPEPLVPDGFGGMVPASQVHHGIRKIIARGTRGALSAPLPGIGEGAAAGGGDDSPGADESGKGGAGKTNAAARGPRVSASDEDARRARGAEEVDLFARIGAPVAEPLDLGGGNTSDYYTSSASASASESESESEPEPEPESESATGSVSASARASAAASASANALASGPDGADRKRKEKSKEKNKEEKKGKRKRRVPSRKREGGAEEGGNRVPSPVTAVVASDGVSVAPEPDTVSRRSSVAEKHLAAEGPGDDVDEGGDGVAEHDGPRELEFYTSDEDGGADPRVDPPANRTRTAPGGADASGLDGTTSRASAGADAGLFFDGSDMSASGSGSGSDASGSGSRSGSAGSRSEGAADSRGGDDKATRRGRVQHRARGEGARDGRRKGRRRAGSRDAGARKRERRKRVWNPPLHHQELSDRAIQMSLVPLQINSLIPRRDRVVETFPIVPPPDPSSPGGPPAGGAVFIGAGGGAGAGGGDGRSPRGASFDDYYRAAGAAGAAAAGGSVAMRVGEADKDGATTDPRAGTGDDGDENGRWVRPVFPSTNPDSRRDAHMLHLWLDDMLERAKIRAGEDELAWRRLGREACHVAFNECTRQVATHCSERGRVLLRLWSVMMDTFDVGRATRAELDEMRALRRENASLRSKLKRTQGRLAAYEGDDGADALAAANAEILRRAQATADEARRECDERLADYQECLDELEAARCRAMELDNALHEARRARELMHARCVALESQLLLLRRVSGQVEDLERDVRTFNNKWQRPTMGTTYLDGGAALREEESFEQAIAVTRAFVEEGMRLREGIYERLGPGGLSGARAARSAADVCDVAAQTDPVEPTVVFVEAPADPAEENAGGDAAAKPAKKKRRKRRGAGGGKTLSHLIPAMGRFVKNIKGKGRLRSLRWLTRVLHMVYSEKLFSDSVSDRDARSRAPLPEFVYTFAQNKYGLKHLAEQNLLDLIVSLDHYSGYEECHAVRTFVQLLDDSGSHPEYLDVYLRLVEEMRNSATGRGQDQVLHTNDRGERFLPYSKALDIAKAVLLLGNERLSRVAAKFARMQMRPPPGFPTISLGRDTTVVDADAFLSAALREFVNISRNFPDLAPDILAGCLGSSSESGVGGRSRRSLKDYGLDKAGSVSSKSHKDLNALRGSRAGQSASAIAMPGGGLIVARGDRGGVPGRGRRGPPGALESGAPLDVAPAHTRSSATLVSHASSWSPPVSARDGLPASDRGSASGAVQLVISADGGDSAGPAAAGSGSRGSGPGVAVHLPSRPTSSGDEAGTLTLHPGMATAGSDASSGWRDGSVDGRGGGGPGGGGGAGGGGGGGSRGEGEGEADGGGADVLLLLCRSCGESHREDRIEQHLARCPVRLSATDRLASLQPAIGVHLETTSSGAILVAVDPTGPAASSGLPEGSLIVSVGGRRVDTAEQCRDAVRTFEPGGVVPVEFVDPRVLGGDKGGQQGGDGRGQDRGADGELPLIVEPGDPRCSTREVLVGAAGVTLRELRALVDVATGDPVPSGRARVANDPEGRSTFGVPRASTPPGAGSGAGPGAGSGAGPGADPGADPGTGTGTGAGVGAQRGVPANGRSAQFVSDILAEL